MLHLTHGCGLQFYSYIEQHSMALARLPTLARSPDGDSERAEPWYTGVQQHQVELARPSTAASPDDPRGDTGTKLEQRINIDDELAEPRLPTSKRGCLGLTTVARPVVRPCRNRS
jgi:hypothetical protein